MAGDSEEWFGNKTLLLLILTRYCFDSGVNYGFQVNYQCQLAHTALTSGVDAQPKHYPITPERVFSHLYPVGF